ncbi:MAG: apolipoprotein N-acyltransferase, partial [Verrucomicrobiota bacterium]
LYVLAFPPFEVGQAAYVFALPMAMWAFLRPGWRLYAGVSAGVAVLGWALLLEWLRNVAAIAGFPVPSLTGWVLVVLVAVPIGGFLFAWLLALRWVLPRVEQRGAVQRILAMLGLAGLWVVFEWVRTWFIFGFPWNPLAATQWRAPVLLQPAAWTGAWGVSFLLIVTNVGVALYLRRILLTSGRGPRRSFWQKLCPEFYVAFGMLGGTLLLFVQTRQEAENLLPMFTGALVQPNIEAELSFDREVAAAQARDIFQLSRLAPNLGAEIIFWPESATPLPVVGHQETRQWVEALARESGLPLLIGSLAYENERWYNGVFLVTPDDGLYDAYYAKRRLVPFGEYNPLRQLLPFVNSIVPLEDDMVPGDRPALLPLRVERDVPADRLETALDAPDALSLELAREVDSYRVGPLVCYEDCFPYLARQQVQAGADFLYVATNNGWFGRTGAARQHAAHSVLRAVETRRPVIRAGNDGWSGWIDERGLIRHEMTDAQGNIDFRGIHPIQVSRDRAFVRQESLYLRWGNWFVWLCAGLCLLGYPWGRSEPTR